MRFSIRAGDGDCSARSGLLVTPRSEVATPAFMPVGTGGAVKAVPPGELEDMPCGMILANTYHLFLRPGMEVIRRFGSLHEFMGWKRSILTDSGGFQIYSLGDNSRVSEGGVTFASHIDGNRHFLTPEDVVDIQRDLDSDLQMVLDYFRGTSVSKKAHAQAVELTRKWAERSRDRFLRIGRENAQFGIVQGGLHEDLREESLAGLAGMDFEGLAVGGLSVGESREDFLRIMGFTVALLPVQKPRYLMGCGTPEEILLAVEQGVDLFDCVLPTRMARNGALFTARGRISIKNRRYRLDKKPPDEQCGCYTCRNYSRAYLRHLYISGEINSAILSTIHNLHFYLDFMDKIRYSITINRFTEFKKSFLDNYLAKE